MIAISPNTAFARLLSLRACVRWSVPSVARCLMALGVLIGLGGIGVPTAAAGSGGVAIGSAPPDAGSTARAAVADGAPAVRPTSVSRTQLRRAQTLLRLYPSGTHDAKTRRVVKRFQRLRGIAQNGVVDLTTYVQIKDAFALLETGGIGVEAASGPATGGTSPLVAATTPPIALPTNLAEITDQERAILDRVAQCDSKGDPTVVSANGMYRGKYQFDKTTWKAVGGTGDPAAASELEQDQRAAILLRQQGTSPWPVCAA